MKEKREWDEKKVGGRTERKNIVKEDTKTG